MQRLIDECIQAEEEEELIGDGHEGLPGDVISSCSIILPSTSGSSGSSGSSGPSRLSPIQKAARDIRLEVPCDSAPAVLSPTLSQEKSPRSKGVSKMLSEGEMTVPRPQQRPNANPDPDEELGERPDSVPVRLTMSSLSLI